MNARTTHASWRAHATSTDQSTPSPRRRTRRSVAALAVLALGLAACGSDDDTADEPSDDTTSDDTGTTAADTDTTDAPSDGGTIRIGAIPDQDPEVLQRQFGLFLFSDILDGADDLDHHAIFDHRFRDRAYPFFRPVRGGQLQRQVVGLG